MQFALLEEIRGQIRFFVLKDEQRKIKAENQGLPVAIIFDGTLQLGEALAVILHFVHRSSLTK